MREITLRSVNDADVKGKRVLVRCDFDVPIEEGKVIDDFRIRAVVPTIELLHRKGASAIILLAHRGRPGGRIDEKLRLAPVEARLRELTKAPFEMRENLRFDTREESNDLRFARELANFGDVYVNEAFADSHRRHASIVGVPTLVPSFAGLRFEEEVTKLSQAREPPKGALAIVGGVKLETKLPLIQKLSQTYEKVLVGGAVANEFRASDKKEHVLLPTDGVRDATHVADIGEKTRITWAQEIAKAPFVLWNGPLGMYERGFTEGTDAIARTIAQAGVRAVIGGGDTIAAIKKFLFDKEKVFLSTGGGAMLQFLLDGTLPAIEVLREE